MILLVIMEKIFIQMHQTGIWVHIGSLVRRKMIGICLIGKTIEYI